MDTSLKISKLANAQTVDIFYAPFIDYLNASSPMSMEYSKNHH
ncbi:hypothetical protein ACI76W_10470 [Capnocytophaga canimorsus]